MILSMVPYRWICHRCRQPVGSNPQVGVRRVLAWNSLQLVDATVELRHHTCIVVLAQHNKAAYIELVLLFDRQPSGQVAAISSSTGAGGRSSGGGGGSSSR